MLIKNYYTTLELPPSATPDEIRKAYRRLAVVHHPDKNPDDPESESRFKELQEAYSVLSNPGQRSRYDQRRWYTDLMAPPAQPVALTADLLHRKTRLLELYIAQLQPSFINRDALYLYVMKHLLSDEAMQLLARDDHGQFRQRIIGMLLKPLTALNYRQSQLTVQKLHTLKELSPETRTAITRYLGKQKQADYWRRYQGFAVVLLTLLLLWFAYRAGQ